MSLAIDVQNISKRYKVPRQKLPYKTLRDSIMGLAKRKTVLYDEFWALKTVSFKIEEGDQFAIIGKNGAGKSTLLKILSRITSPSQGKVTILGKVSSLLEIGTGFHPELTGRENVFLNGTMLGRSLKDVKRKFDEIVSFSEIESFIDMPVKHYSSGMYMRLAFSISSHLYTDIFIVDEALSVGDHAFQKKCLDRMETIRKEGRTIIFVSHDMSYVSRLCNKGIVLDKGKIIKEGNMDECLACYDQFSQTHFWRKWTGDVGDESIRFHRMELLNLSDKQANPCSEMNLEIDYDILIPNKDFLIGIEIENLRGERVAVSRLTDTDKLSFTTKGKHSVLLSFNMSYFTGGDFSIGLYVGIHNDKVIIDRSPKINFSYVPNKLPLGHFQSDSISGVFYPKEWRWTNR